MLVEVELFSELEFVSEVDVEVVLVEAELSSVSVEVEELVPV